MTETTQYTPIVAAESYRKRHTGFVAVSGHFGRGHFGPGHFGRGHFGRGHFGPGHFGRGH